MLFIVLQHTRSKSNTIRWLLVVGKSLRFMNKKVTSGRSRSFEIILISRACVMSLILDFQFRLKYVSILYRLYHIQRRILAWAWNTSDVSLGSLKMAPLNRSYTSSYLSFIATMAVSCTVFQRTRNIDRKTWIFHTPFHLTCTIT